MARRKTRRGSATRGWAKLKPTSSVMRMDVYRKGGPKCFLDPKRLKYPVCAKQSGKIDCRGVASAKQRASQQHRKDLVAKADRIARRVGCAWARK